MIEDVRVRIAPTAVAGDQPLKLDSPLRADLWNIHFSPDGNYVLAQDESVISVIDRNKAVLLFKIDAPDMNRAYFTPDSKSIVFDNDSMRVEKWDIATQSRASVTEMNILQDCTRTWLMPAGDALLCEQWHGTESPAHDDFKLFDVTTNSLLWDKPHFFEFYGDWGEFAVTTHFSPDERYLLLSASHTVQAFDLQTREPIDTGSKIKSYMGQTGFGDFVGPTELLVATGAVNKGLLTAQVLSFPDGKKLLDTQVVRMISRRLQGTPSYRAPHSRPPCRHPGLRTRQADRRRQLPSHGCLRPFRCRRSRRGRSIARRYRFQHAVTCPSAYQQPDVVAGLLVSPDGHFLAISLKSRSEIWDLNTNNAISVARPFRSIWIDDQDQMFTQFTKFHSSDPEAMVVSFLTQTKKSSANMTMVLCNIAT